MTKVNVVVREKIRTIASTGVVMVDGCRLGSLAAHHSLNQSNPDGSPIWTITHVPSGMRLGSRLGFVTEAAAVSFLKALDALPIDWADARCLKRNPAMRDAFDAISVLCGGFDLVDVPDGPEMPE